MIHHYLQLRLLWGSHWAGRMWHTPNDMQRAVAPNLQRTCRSSRRSFIYVDRQKISRKGEHHVGLIVPGLPTWYDLVNLISQVDTISGIRWQGEDDTNRCLGGGRPWCQMSKIRWFFLMVSVCFSDSADFCWFLLISASLRILLALSHGQTSAPSSWCSIVVQPTAGSPGHLVWFDTVATWRIQIQTWDWSLTKFLQFSVSVGTNQYAIPSLFGR